MKARAVGQVFTPLAAAQRIVVDHGVFDAWLGGATVLDPTAGDGSFLEALIALAFQRGVASARVPVRRLYGIERDASLLAHFDARIRARYGLRVPDANLCARDLFDPAPPLRADVLVGNPPWANYVDLPETERARLRPLFHRCGLIGDARRLLLGGSRIDLAALVIAWCMERHLVPGGRAVFLAPLSLYLNDGAHEAFRRHIVGDVRYALRGVWDHAADPIFPGVATRYGLVTYERDAEARWPIPWHEHVGGRWVARGASPVDAAVGPLRVFEDAQAAHAALAPPTPVPWRPRQGVNTGGATALFVFDRCEIDGEDALLENAALGAVKLPRRFVYPLMTRETFGDAPGAPRRWILIPHDPATGRPLDHAAIEAAPLLARHLRAHEARLRARKGTLLGTHLARGHWWALLGVGPYTFAPWRVAWEALGRSTFRAVLLGREAGLPWQGNQAMHAYVPVPSRSEGERVLGRLARERIEPLLRAHRMEGTCNWAQPGRILRLLQSAP